MASPEELTPLLPETLPEDFGDWDSEASPAPSLPVNADEWEAWAAAHPFSDTSKPLGQSLDRDAEASSADRPRVAGSASSAPEFAKQEVVFSYEDSEASPKAKPVNSREEWEAWIESHSSSETPKPFGQSAERKAILSPVREAGLSIREAGLSIREAGLSDPRSRLVNLRWAARFGFSLVRAGPCERTRVDWQFGGCITQPHFAGAGG